MAIEERNKIFFSINDDDITNAYRDRIRELEAENESLKLELGGGLDFSSPVIGGSGTIGNILIV